MSDFDLPTLAQAKHTLELIAQHNLTCSDMKVLHKGYLSDLLEAIRFNNIGFFQEPRNEIRLALGLLPLNPTLLIDYDLSLEESISMCKCESVRTRQFKLKALNAWLIKQGHAGKGKKTISIRLSQLPQDLNLGENEAEKYFDSKYRLASYQEILAFGAVYPRLQNRFRIFGRSYESPHTIGVGYFHPNLYVHDLKRGINFSAGGTSTGIERDDIAFLFVEK
jgi:hypothetical protein